MILAKFQLRNLEILINMSGSPPIKINMRYSSNNRIRIRRQWYRHPKIKVKIQGRPKRGIYNLFQARNKLIVMTQVKPIYLSRTPETCSHLEVSKIWAKEFLLWRGCQKAAKGKPKEVGISKITRRFLSITS